VHALRTITPTDSRTKVLILGTHHLRELGDDFQPELLSGLIEILASYQPDLIGIESLPPDQIAHMQQRGGNYTMVAESFASDHLTFGKQAQEFLGLSQGDASRQADTLLVEYAENEGMPSSARIRLVSLLLASYDLHSALLQWSYLPEKTRTSSNNLPDQLAEKLNGLLNSQNERISIGVRLARLLGHQHLISIDDHLEKGALLGFSDELSLALQDNPAVKALGEAPEYIRTGELQQAGAAGGDLLPLFRYLNSTAYATGDVNLQWGLFLRAEIPRQLGRSRMALWEVRNLNIASHIRAASATEPGGKMLVIIGAAHKPFLDAYLRQMSDVSVVDAVMLLGS